MLPERYLVKVETNEQSIQVSNYARRKYNSSRSTPYEAFNPTDWPYHEVNAENAEKFNIWSTLSYGRDKLKLFTFEEWEKELYKDEIIVGYKTPKDLYGGVVKKDTVYVACFNNNFYEPQSNNSNDNKESENIVLPKEIVEEWEPVYEEVYKDGDFIVVDFGSWKETRKIFDVRIEDSVLFWNQGPNDNDHSWKLADVRHATPEEIEEFNNIIKVGEYISKPNREEGTIAFGCTTFDKEDIDTLEKIAGKTSLQIAGTEITRELLSKVKKSIGYGS